MPPYLSVVIPAYNEADRLPKTLYNVDAYIRSARFSAEVIVVDDGSTDATASVARDFVGSHDGWRLITLPRNGGKGAAVKAGMLAAAGQFRLFMDADGSTAVTEFERLRPLAEAGCPVVIASRAVAGAELDPPQHPLKSWSGKGGNALVRALVLPGISDTQCGFKCFSGEAAAAIFSLVSLDRWAFDIEALVIARELGYDVREVPVRWVNDPRSSVRWTDYVAALRDTLHIRRRRAFGAYRRRM